MAKQNWIAHSKHNLHTILYSNGFKTFGHILWYYEGITSATPQVESAEGLGKLND